MIMVRNVWKASLAEKIEYYLHLKEMVGRETETETQREERQREERDRDRERRDTETERGKRQGQRESDQHL